MKKTVYILLLLIFSCKGSTRMDSSITGGTDTNNTTDTSGTLVRIFITESNSYCGGMRPTDEMYREITSPHIIPGKTIYIKQDANGNSDLPILYTVSADDSGFVLLRLPPGNYILVDEKKRDRAYFSQLINTYRNPTIYRSAIDSVCLESWYKKPDLSFSVTKDAEVSVAVNFHNPCSWHSVPCTSYDGPLPP